MQSYFPSFGWAKDVNFEQFSVDRDRTVPRDLKLSRRDNGFPHSRDLCATIHQCEIIAKLSVARPHNTGVMITIFATHCNWESSTFFREREGGRLTRKLLVQMYIVPIDDPPFRNEKEYLHQLDRLLRIVLLLLRAGTPCQWELYNIIYKYTHKVLPARNFYIVI